MAQSLSDLPEEVVEEIAKYLTVRDVQACSLVNRGWRTAFNNNRIWRQYCTFHPEYFDKQISKLGFSSEDDCDGCEAKQQVFRELLVQKNLCENNLHKAAVSTNLKEFLSIKDEVDEEGNHWLVLIGKTETEESYQLQVWSLSDEPSLKSSTVLPHLGGQEYCKLETKLNNGKLFCLFNSHVLVYHFCQRQYYLKFLLKIEGPKVSNSLQRKFVHVNNLVLCFFHITDISSMSPIVYVWDEEGIEIYKNDYSILEDCQKSNHNFESFDSELDVQCRSSDKILVASTWYPVDTNVSKHAIQIFCVLKLKYFTVFMYEDMDYMTYELLPGNIVCLLWDVDLNNSRFQCLKSNGTIIYDSLLEGSYVGWKLAYGYRKNKVVLHGGNVILIMDCSHGIIECGRFELESNIVNLEATVLNENLLLFQGYYDNEVDCKVWDLRNGQETNVFKGFQKNLHINYEDFSFKNTDLYRSPPKIITTTRNNSFHFEIDVISSW